MYGKLLQQNLFLSNEKAKLLAGSGKMSSSMPNKKWEERDGWKSEGNSVRSEGKKGRVEGFYTNLLHNRYRKMIETVLGINGFYFSYSYDLTHSLQRISQLDVPKGTPLYSRVRGGGGGGSRR